MAYATLTELKAYLGIDSDTVTDDDLLTRFLGQAQQAVDLHFLRTFEAATDTIRLFDAEKDVVGGLLILDQDLCAVTEIINGDGTVVSPSEYLLLPREAPYFGVRLRRNSGVSWNYPDGPEEAISVEGRWAYATTAPAAIKAVTTWLAATMYRTKDNVAQTGNNAAVAAEKDILSDELPPDIRLLMQSIPRRTEVRS